MIITTKKRNIVLILMLLSVISITVSYLIIRSSTNKKITKEEQPSLPKDKIPYALIPESKPLLTKEVEFNIPDSLPLLKIEDRKSLSENEILNLGIKLGFTQSPTIGADPVSGSAYFFNNNTNYMIVWQKQNTIRYGASNISYTDIQKAPNKQISEQELFNIAKTLFKEKFGIPDNTLEYQNIAYYKVEQGLEYFYITDKTNAEVYHINFSPKYNDFPIITEDPKNTLISAEILKDGTIFLAEINLVGNISPTLSPVKIKTKEQILSSLDKAEIISVEYGNANLPDLSGKDFENIKVDKISTVFLYSGINSDLMKPYFILNAEGNFKDQTKNIHLDLLLNALP